MREISIVAGQRAYETGEEISRRALREAIDSLRRGMARVERRESEVVLSASLEASAAPTFSNAVEQRAEQ